MQCQHMYPKLWDYCMRLFFKVIHTTKHFFISRTFHPVIFYRSSGDKIYYKVFIVPRAFLNIRWPTDALVERNAYVISKYAKPHANAVSCIMLSVTQLQLKSSRSAGRIKYINKPILNLAFLHFSYQLPFYNGLSKAYFQ